ncbi:MAG: FkbM family methyltransferase [Erythrobacter sp.]|uniref:FkbM family methyltransferase n=1 Tax=Erythrobacter sp. TaxID=1042 RepID=UPI0026153258|nr:FkbM family methyltransferase [Erythrobacter sp.]MDJ0979420.1 FkbM family methyltransferase [Erythrobacter sp.]
MNEQQAFEPARGFDLFSIPELTERSRYECEKRIRARCQNAYLGSDIALCRVLGRYKMFVDTNDRDMSPHLMFDGFWEFWVTEAVCELVKPGMVVADIGANHGYFSLLMAELVGPEGFVHAFEPNARLAKLVTQSLAVNGFGERSEVNTVALAGEDRVPMALVIPPQQESKAYLEPWEGELSEHAALVQTRRLDSEERWSQIELAKVDVEGAEELLWAGARGLLDSGTLKTVLLEFTAARYSDPAAFLDRLAAPGFTILRIDHVAGIVPTTHEELLARSPMEDVMLALRR